MSVNHFHQIVDQIEEGICIILVTVICVVVGLQVFSRLAIRYPLSWTEELATGMFLWLVMIGASLALKRNEHFAVELLHSKLRTTDRKIARVIVDLSLIAFSLLILIEGSQLTWMNLNVSTSVMEISRAWFYAALPVGGILMLLRSVQKLCHARQPQPPDDGSAAQDRHAVHEPESPL